MSSAVDTTNVACGCGATVPLTPVTIDNRAGLDAIAYRIGTWGTFRAAMIAGLSESAHPQLAALSTRDPSDFSLALLDAWAVTSDVLTFYQERIANEAYLRTATERMSVGFLAGLIGYEPRPGVAASTQLAFKLDTAPGAPATSTIPAGTPVQSVPGAGQTSQTFETIATIEARPAWNALTPLVVEARLPQAGDPSIYLQGTSTGLNPGDGFLVVGGERESNVNSHAWDFRRVVSVTPDTASARTLVAFDRPLGVPSSGPAKIAIRVFAFRQRAALWGNNAVEWWVVPASAQDKGGGLPGPYTPSNWVDSAYFAAGTTTFNLDAVYPKVVPNIVGNAVRSWVVFTCTSPNERVTLCSVTTVAEQSTSQYLLSGKSTTLTVLGPAEMGYYSPRNAALFVQSDELEIAPGPYRTPSGTTLPSTGLTLQAGMPSPVEGSSIALSQFVEGLSEGQTLVVTGKRLHVQLAFGVNPTPPLALTAPDGTTVTTLSYMQVLEVMAPPVQQGTNVRLSLQTLDGQAGSLTTESANIVLIPAPANADVVSEVATLVSAPPVPDPVDGETTTTLQLSGELANSYDAASVGICANVAPATHGSTIHEVLGNGDGTQAFPTFTLLQSPLTFVPATNAAGAASTLAVTVNDVTWQGVEALYGATPTARIYVTEIADDATTTIEFGDGVEGARLPTGSQNVRAVYRIGLGTAGNLAAGQLSLLAARPLGVQSVTNPLPAAGGGDPEVLADARTNAGLTVQTIDRVVSLLDYENFSKAFAGVGKASAAWVWDGYRNSVLVTLAASDGSTIDPTQNPAQNLIGALAAAGDPFVSVIVVSYRSATFKLGLTVAIEPESMNAKSDVLSAVEAALRAAFSFSQRGFAQTVTFSEVITVAQEVTGVLAVAITALYRSDSVPSTTPPVVMRLPAAGPTPPQGVATAALGAELLTLDPGPLLELSVMS